MPILVCNKTLLSNTRADIRNEVSNWFLSEQPGTGKDALRSVAIYTVELFGNYTIELHRPAALNKGFDFTVHISGMKFKKNKTYTNPSHDDIINTLQTFRNSNTNFYDNTIKPILNNIFNCQNITFDPTSNLGNFTDYSGTQRPIEIIILALKWLFIEQDITYWNWSGRQMLHDKLSTNNLI